MRPATKTNYKFINQKPFVIGLTGPVCSGKTTAADFLRRSGYSVTDVDGFAHTLYEKGTGLYRKITRKYGKKILDKQGKINRRALRAIAFSSIAGYNSFVKIIYPVMNSALMRMLKGPTAPVVILDMAVLFESGFYKKTNAIIYIHPGKKVLKRAVTNRGNSRMVKKITAFQSLFAPTRKISLSDVIVFNDSTIKKLQQTVLEAVRDIIAAQRACKRKRRGKG